MKKLISIIGVMVIGALLITGCSKKEMKSLEYNAYVDGKKVTKTINYYETSSKTNDVIIDTSKGTMIAELYPNIAPLTVRNFKALVKSNFYSDLTFHRVIKDFMIQTGDNTGTGSGGSSVTVKGEFSNNGVANSLSHTRGVLSMARTDKDMDSASSQFFIVEKDSTNLDGSYASFGKVIAGLDVIDAIATVQTDSNDKPIVTQKLNSIKFISIVE